MSDRRDLYARSVPSSGNPLADACRTLALYDPRLETPHTDAERVFAIRQLLIERRLRRLRTR